MANSRPASVVKATEDVVGKNVLNNANEDLGNIKEVMVNKSNGHADYVVLESGTILGLGGKLFAIPWNAIQYDKAKECFRLNIEKERLKNAPGFDKDHWPNMADKTWENSITTYYQTSSTGSSDSTQF